MTSSGTPEGSRPSRSYGTRIVSPSHNPNRPFEDFPLGVAPAAVYGGLEPAQAVHAATGLAARSIGMAGDIGTLTPGRCADLLVVAGNVAQDPVALARAQWVLRDGVVASQGRLLAAGVSSWRAGTSWLN